MHPPTYRPSLLIPSYGLSNVRIKSFNVLFLVMHFKDSSGRFVPPTISLSCFKTIQGFVPWWTWGTNRFWDKDLDKASIMHPNATKNGFSEGPLNSKFWVFCTLMTYWKMENFYLHFTKYDAQTTRYFNGYQDGLHFRLLGECDSRIRSLNLRYFQEGRKCIILDYLIIAVLFAVPFSA